MQNGTILDEIQNAPGLLSYILVYAESCQREGLFVLTGSRHFELMESVRQSLAGRNALLQLLPFSFEEIYSFYSERNANKYIYQGFYPRIYNKNHGPTKALVDYYSTYVERNIRKLSAIHNLHLFHKFTSLCAGRIGQILNLSSLASDVGISRTTAREWLILLEVSYIVFILQPYYANFGKRFVKSPKLYFYDTGLASSFGNRRRKACSTSPAVGKFI